MTTNLQRRRMLVKSAAGITILAPTFFFMGCNSSSTSLSADSTTTESSSGSNTGGSSSSGGSVETTTDWASGGTVSITESFPDDSLFDAGSSCSVELTESLTEGPCYFDSDYRDDISEQQTGLPMMLCLQLVDSDGSPLSGYEIEVWHCDVEGIYSGDSSDSVDGNGFNSSFCTGNDSAALAAKWFRGIAVTDASGRVNFYSCFPGWYSSRAIHIHFRVRSNNSDQLISQFGFDDDFVDAICSTHPDYLGRGEPDTHNSRDTVFDGDDDELFNFAQNTDGSLLAWKRIIIS